MKNSIRYIVSVMAVVGLLSGCGGEYAGMSKGNTASGSAVSMGGASGSAVSDKLTHSDVASGSAVKRRGDMSSHRFCTDTNLYYVSEDKSKLMQARLDGTHKECIIKAETAKGVWICYVDESWVYYGVYAKNELEEILYRVPIWKDDKGYDMVHVSAREEIVEGYEGVCLKYVDSAHLFYSMEETLGKYDICKHEIISETNINGEFTCSTGVFRVGGYYVAATDCGKILVQPVNNDQWTTVSDFIAFWGHDVRDFVVQDDHVVYYPQYVTGDKIDYDPRHDYEYAFPRSDDRYNIISYDGEKETDFVSWEKLEKTVLEAEGIEKLDCCRPDYMFLQGGRLYIQVQIDWESEGVYHREYMILSQGTGERDSEIRCERELTECMRSHVKSRTGKWAHIFQSTEEVIKEHMVINNARCIGMVNQKAYLNLYDYEKDKGRMGCFELNTGKFQWVDREDALFYELGCDYELSDIKNIYRKKKEGDMEYRENERFDWRGPGEDGEFFEN